MKITIACLIALLATSTSAVKMSSSMKALSADHDWDDLDLTEEQEQQIADWIDDNKDELEDVAE